jgi:uncharacterized membrane protein YgcG
MTDTPTAAVEPGFLAFVAFVILALSLWLLMKNMNSRMRRMSYRQQQAHRGRDDAQAGPADVGGARRDDDRVGEGEGEGADGGASGSDGGGGAD